MLILAQASHSLRMKILHIKLNCLALLSLFFAMHFVVLAPLVQDVLASEVPNHSLSLVDKLTVGLGPFREQLVEVLHLPRTPVVDRAKFLLLNVDMPVPQSLPASLDAAVRVEILFHQPVNKLVAPEIQESILHLDVV